MTRLIIALAILSVLTSCKQSQTALLHRAYDELELGCITPEGWLKEMLERQRDGITANLDEIYPRVMDDRNGWLGGDGDQWERGPYWVDGLLPLGYILHDEKMIAKAEKWVEWSLASQQPNGQFGPTRDYPEEEGLQRGKTRDWWPRIVILKIMMQHYQATGDERVINFMRKYFKYQLDTLPEFHLGHWTYWAEYRRCDNMLAALWLYEKTGDKWLLDLVDLLHEQGFDFVDFLSKDESFAQMSTIHCVNLAQGLKEPLVYSQISGDPFFNELTKKAIERIRLYDGFPNGMYGGDEILHGNSPNRGIELCSIVEMMFSLEQMAQISGDVSYIDLLEKIAYNALPTQISDDFKYHQYYQTPNQVNITRGLRNFDCENEGTANLFGILTGYPCCLSNLHQGWPKFTQNLWLKARDGGLAALSYAPCKVTVPVDGKEFIIEERTKYPFEESIKMTIVAGNATLPLHLRIPGWCKSPRILVNGEETEKAEAGTTITLNRTWVKGDEISIQFPMDIEISRWYEHSAAVERGPLVYALKLTENWEERAFKENEFNYKWQHGKTYWEVTTDDAWNYGLLDYDINNPAETFSFTIDKDKLAGNWYWNPDDCPISIKARATKFSQWTLYNGMAGPLPFSPLKWHYGHWISDTRVSENQAETITLIPYGCTTLRISEFPVAHLNEK